MKTKVNEVPTPALIKLMYSVENLIQAENKPFDNFLKAFQKLKRTYKAGMNSKK